MEMQEAHESAKESLVGYLDTIHGQMEALVTAHLAACDQLETQKTDWKDRSILRLGMHKSGNHLQVKWFTIKWYGKGTARKSVKGSIRKSPNEDTYSMAQLREKAQEWEWPLVEATEIRLGILRRQASFVAKALTSLRYAQMALDKYAAWEPKAQD